MTYEIVMPQLGLTMTEGSVSSWLKRPGEWVEKGEILFIVETDKVEMEVESFGSGYLSPILVNDKQVVPVGTRLATLEETVEATTPQPAGKAESKIPVSPRARKLANELGIDLASIKRAGNRITEEEVRRHFEQTGATALQPSSAARADHSAAHKLAARRLTESFQSAPHFYLGVEVDVTSLVSLREELNANSTGRVRVTYTDLLLKALADALRDNPEVNSYWKTDRVVRHDAIDIGCAVQTDSGPVVPVIRKADRLDIFGIAEHRSDLVTRARSRSLTVADIEGGSATLSNLGAFGIDWFQAILNPPQSVILAAGQIATRPVVVNNQVQARETIHLHLSADHRVLDGAGAAAFLVRIQQLIVHPDALARRGSSELARA